jgi:hypothetical protein
MINSPQKQALLFVQLSFANRDSLEIRIEDRRVGTPSAGALDSGITPRY